MVGGFRRPPDLPRLSDPVPGAPEDPYAPRRKKSGCGIVALVVGLVVGCGVLAALCCGGLFLFGTRTVAEQVKTDLRGNPVIEEHLGPIDTIELDWIASQNAPGEDEFVFDVEGPKGTGRIQVVTETVDAETEDVVSGTLELPNGETYDLFPDGEGGAAGP